MNYNEDVFECTTKIVAAAIEEAEVEINAEGGEQVAEFFAAIYHRLTAIANGEDETNKTGSFEIFQNENEEYHFILKATNGETIAESQGYKTKAACLKGIESVKRNSKNANIEEVKA